MRLWRAEVAEVWVFPLGGGAPTLIGAGAPLGWA